MITIPVDTNSIAHNGLIVASTRRVKGAVRVGDKVRVDDSAEDASFDAVVAEVEERRIYLQIDWESEFRDVKLQGTKLAWPTLKTYVAAAYGSFPSLAAAYAPTRRHVGSSAVTLIGVPV